MRARVVALVYGVVCYVLFLAVFLYAIGFVGNVFVPKSIDSGSPVQWPVALVINAALLSAFAVQHSAYVVAASAVLALLLWQWRPISAVVWDVHNPTGQIALRALFWLGWGILLLSTFLVDHFELFGLKQVWSYFRGKSH